MELATSFCGQNQSVAGLQEEWDPGAWTLSRPSCSMVLSTLGHSAPLSGGLISLSEKQACAGLSVLEFIQDTKMPTQLAHSGHLLTCCPLYYLFSCLSFTFPMASLVLPQITSCVSPMPWRIYLPMQETQEIQVQSLGQEDPLE